MTSGGPLADEIGFAQLSMGLLAERLGVKTDRVLASWEAMLHGYRIDSGQKIHAMRMLRSALHGFATLEVAGGFRIGTDVEDSFTWMIDFIDHGLRSTPGI